MLCVRAWLWLMSEYMWGIFDSNHVCICLVCVARCANVCVCVCVKGVCVCEGSMCVWE